MRIDSVKINTFQLFVRSILGKYTVETTKERKRKNERRKHLPTRQPEKVILIDGNLSHYPIAYCAIHGAYLTEGLASTHRCMKRQCNGYRTDLYEEG